MCQYTEGCMCEDGDVPVDNTHGLNCTISSAVFK